MELLGILDRSFSRRVIWSIVLISAASAAATSLIYYLAIDRTLSDEYREKLLMISTYKFEIIRMSLLLFPGFSMIAVLFLGLYGVVYSHRIVGPLFRVRGVAQRLAALEFGIRTSFRDTDAIHPLAESLNRFSESVGARHAEMQALMEAIRRDAHEMRELVMKGEKDAADNVRKGLAEKTERLSRVFSEIRL